nr:hypothetical protein CFP56_00988 [Quercus suber]
MNCRDYVPIHVITIKWCVTWSHVHSCSDPPASSIRAIRAIHQRPGTAERIKYLQWMLLVPLQSDSRHQLCLGVLDSCLAFGSQDDDVHIPDLLDMFQSTNALDAIDAMAEQHHIW